MTPVPPIHSAVVPPFIGYILNLKEILFSWEYL
jgi:hypothetical protein